MRAVAEGTTAGLLDGGAPSKGERARRREVQRQRRYLLRSRRAVARSLVACAAREERKGERREMNLGFKGEAAAGWFFFERKHRAAVGSVEDEIDGHQRPGRCWASFGPRGTGRAGEFPAQAFAAAWDAGTLSASLAVGHKLLTGRNNKCTKVLFLPLLRLVLRVYLKV